MLIFQAWILPLHAQSNQRIDSLERLLDTTAPDARVRVLSELAWANHNVNPRKGVQYGLEGLELCKELNLPDVEAELKLYLGICYYNLNAFDQSIDYFLQSLRIKEQLNDRDGISAISNNLGNIYKDMGNFEKANEAYQRAYEMGVAGGKSKVAATALSNLAITHRLMQDYDHALEYNFKAYDIRKEIGDQRGIAMSLNNIAIIYADSGYSGRDLQKATDYLQQSLQIKELIQDRFGICQSMVNLGQIHLEQNRYIEASQYFLSALDLAKEIKANSVIIACYQNLANLNFLNGRYKKAYEYHVLYSDLKDSSFNIESSNKIAEMEVRYETEKKEKENEILRQESKIQSLQIIRQRNLRNFFIFAAILILIMAIIIYSRYLFKKRTNRILEEKNTQLALLNATKDKFFSIIAHDLKNPFGTLRMVSEQLQERFSELNDEQRLRIISTINNSANLTHNLLENLLLWSHLQTGKIPCNPEKFQLSIIIVEVVELLKIAAEKKDIRITTNCSPEIYVYADLNMTSTILRNLLTNAVKFMEKPGKIDIQVLAIKDFTEVRISDEGIGISKNDVGRLFRIDTNHAAIGKSKEKGTGLGLILCKEFVEKIGGEIRAESEPGKGSIFIFTLPMAK